MKDQDFNITLNTEEKVVIDGKEYLFQDREDIHKDKTQQICHYCDLVPYVSDEGCKFKCIHTEREDGKNGTYKLNKNN